MLPRHALLSLYRGAWWCARPLLPGVLRRRIRQGKEDPERLAERQGFASRARPAGPLVWLHGASVGEALALLGLVDAFLAMRMQVLVTTGTVTSAAILAQRLPPGAVHQYVPLDAPPFVARFLDHWQPQLVVLAESEIWPNIVLEAKRRAVPLALVNARMSARSFGRWQRLRGLAAALLGSFDYCLAQTPEDAARLSGLGARDVRVCGNLKYDAAPLPADLAELARLRASFGARPLWVAASLYAGEEAVLLAAHAALLGRYPALLTLIAPRHPGQGSAIAQAARAQGLACAQRSMGAAVGAATGVYICDTMGELGLLYRLGGPVFMGKSLVGSGGQNPLEAAVLGNALVHGPAVGNFAEVYRLLDAAGGAVEVLDGAALAQELARLLGDPAACATMAAAALAVVRAQGGATQRIMQALAHSLPPARGEP